MILWTSFPYFIIILVLLCFHTKLDIAHNVLNEDLLGHNLDHRRFKILNQHNIRVNVSTSRRGRVQGASRSTGVDIRHLGRVCDEHPSRGNRLTVRRLPCNRWRRHYQLYFFNFRVQIHNHWHVSVGRARRTEPGTAGA